MQIIKIILIALFVAVLANVVNRMLGTIWPASFIQLRAIPVGSFAVIFGAGAAIGFMVRK